MKIGIISDSHDHLENIKKAISILNKNNAEVLIHCGDFCAPFVMEELSEFDGEIHCVFGNIDDRFNTPKKAKKLNINFHGDLAEMELSGRKIAVNHYPKIAEALASIDVYDAVFYGHTHKSEKKKINNTLLLNPGEIMGRISKPTLAVYNTESNDAEIIEIQ